MATATLARRTLSRETDVEHVVTELQRVQPERAWYMKTRIMLSNRLLHSVAGTLGYRSGLEKVNRAKIFKEAVLLIKHIKKGEEVESPLYGMVITTSKAIHEFDLMAKLLESDLVRLAKQLPVADWVEERDQLGFGLQSLGTVIGETGDLSNYANPAKVWRRMGCAPWTKDGETHMGSTWRCRTSKRGVVKLEKEDWEEFGYSPRRRSISYLIGESLMKGNYKKAKDSDEVVWCGPYRQRYDESRARYLELHTDARPIYCHLHGMLLAAKLLYKNLWIEWNR